MDRAHTDLVERDGPLAAVGALADGLARGAGGLCWIEGDAGTGKTAVLHAAEAALRDAGATVVRVAAAPEGRDDALAVAGALLRAAGTDADAGAGVFTGAARPARVLVAEDGDPVAAPNVSLVDAAAWALANLAERAPVALIADDAHWADVASLRVLAQVASWLPELPVALVVGARPVASGLRAHAAAAIRAAGEADAQRLGPLSDDGLAAVIARVRPATPPAPPALVAACAAASHGNPLLLREALAAIANIPDADAPAALATTAAPGGGRLVAGAEPTAEALAVLGPDATPARLARLTGRDAARVAADLTALRATGLLEPAPSLAFSHAVLRAAVRGRLEPGRAAALGGAVARLLDADGEPAWRVAPHLLGAPAAADPWAAEILLAAAAHATGLGAPECAVPALRRALAEPPPPARRADVLLALAAAEAAAGAETAGARYREALALLKDDNNSEARLAALVALAEWENARGRPGAGAAVLAEAEAEAEEAARKGGDPDRARSLEGARLAMSTLDPALRPAVQARVAQLAADPPADPTPGERGLLAMLAWEQARTGAPRDSVLRLARAALDDGRLLADQTADGIGVYVAAGALLIAGAFAEDVAHLDAALVDARARGSATAFADASFCRGWPLLALGRIDDAAADFELALAAVRRGWSSYVPVARGGLAAAVLEREGPAAAAAALDLPALRAGWDDSPMLPDVLVVAAQIAHDGGDPRQAHALASEAGERLAALGWSGSSQIGWRPVAAAAARADGRAAVAGALVEEELDRARAAGVPQAIAQALRARGDREALHEALAVLDGDGAHLERARCTVALGAAELAAGDAAAARATLRTGLDAADRLGARVLAARARAALVAAGGRPRRARLTGPASLTPAERRVAALAAGGATNREIAEALWVTTKAVEFHLSRAYAKLGIAGRPGLAEALEDRAA